MEKRQLDIFFPLSLATLIPVPGRFAFAVTLIVLLYFLVAASLLFKRLVLDFFDEDSRSLVMALVLICLCVLFRQILILYSPVTALVLGLSIFMPALTSFILGNLWSSEQANFLIQLKNELKNCTRFSLFTAAFFLLRDVLGYGTFSLPSPSGLWEVRLFSLSSSSVPLSFFASIPGAIVLLFLCFSVFRTILHRAQIASTSYEYEVSAGEA